MEAVLAVDGIAVVDPAWTTPTAGPGELLIEVRATAINRLDTMQRRGAAAPPPGVTPVLGLEVAGVVVALGEGLAEDGGWAIGDGVMALVPGGGNAQFVAVAAETAMRKPAGLGWCEAATVPEVWLTAYQLLHLVGDVRAGEIVLVHAGQSSVRGARAFSRGEETASPHSTCHPRGGAVMAEHAVVRGARWPCRRRSLGDASFVLSRGVKRLSRVACGRARGVGAAKARRASAARRCS